MLYGGQAHGRRIGDDLHSRNRLCGILLPYCEHPIRPIHISKFGRLHISELVVDRIAARFDRNGAGGRFAKAEGTYGGFLG